MPGSRFTWVLLTNQLTQHIEQWQSEITPDQIRSFLSEVGFVNTKKTLSVEDIPKLEGFTVSHIDVHGNIKLNVRESDVHERTWHWAFHGGHNKPKILIGDKILDVEIKRTPRLFDLKTGEGGLYTGSSGANWQGAYREDDKIEDGFLEIAIVGGNAAEQLGLTLEELKEIKVIEFVKEYEETVQVPQTEKRLQGYYKYYNDNSDLKPADQKIPWQAYGLGV